MGLTEKEKSRRYRERLKINPEKLEERKRKKRESYHKNKKLISGLQPEEQKNCRIIWKLRKQEQRKRQKRAQDIINDTPPSSPSILQQIDVLEEQNVPTPPASPDASLDGHRERGRKKIRRDRTKIYKENLKLQNEADKWKKKCEKYKKRAQRREKILRKMKEKKPKTEDGEIQHKYKILTSAIQEKYNKMKARRGKHIIQSIFKNIEASQKKNIIKESLEGKIRTTTDTRNGNTELTMKIKRFFIRDDVSRNTAGKKETVSKGREKVQKRFLLDSMKNLFKAFKTENPGIKCSYFNFTKHRPFYVVRPTVDGRQMCLCKTHTNAEAKTRVLKQKGVINATDISTLILETVCDSNKIDCMYGNCVQCKDRVIKINDDKVQGKIQWCEWVREEETYIKEGKKIKAVKNVKKLKEDTVQNLIEGFKVELKTLKKHIFNMKTQYRNFRQSVDEIKANEAVILVDFSENYNAKCTEEIQAHHFGGSRNQVTLHTVVVYVYDKDSNHKALSFCSVSPCNIHQPAAIWAHLHPILSNISENHPAIDTIHFFSDGPFSQYRQKANFYLACTKPFDYGFQAFSWSFFEAGHGKGPADGIGGYLKREADNKVATGKDITDALGFYQVLQESSKIRLFYVTKEEIDAVQKDIPRNLRPLSGTKEVHQIFSKIRGQIMFRNLSCFCSRGLCDCLFPKCFQSFLPTSASRNTFTVPVTCEDIPQPDNLALSLMSAPTTNIEDCIFSDDDLPLNQLATSNKKGILFTDLSETRHRSIYKTVYGSSDDSDDETNIAEPQPSVSRQNDELPGIGDYLQVKVFATKGKSYHTYACVAQSNLEDDGEIKVTFLKCVKGGRLFILDEKDVSYVAYEDIIKKLPNPEVQRKRGVDYFKFSCDINVFEK